MRPNVMLFIQKIIILQKLGIQLDICIIIILYLIVWFLIRIIRYELLTVYEGFEEGRAIVEWAMITASIIK